MLSICIPIYNFDVTQLVLALAEQINVIDEKVELVLIDDASSVEYRNVNRTTCQQYGRYIELPTNIGRSGIRNKFLEYAQNNFLLFLDCDGAVEHQDFIQKYIETIKTGKKIVCGGRVYPKEKAGKDRMLRWHYGHEKESKTYEERKEHPNRSFMTNNFCVEKELLKSIRFDERITQYGHEDTLFGYQLKQRHIPIEHIDNPVLNIDVETNQEFLEKTIHGIESLSKILDFLKQDTTFVEEVTLLRAYQKVNKPVIREVFHLLFAVVEKPLKNWLLKGNSPLILFDIYKLAYLNKIRRGR